MQEERKKDDEILQKEKDPVSSKETDQSDVSKKKPQAEAGKSEVADAGKGDDEKKSNSSSGRTKAPSKPSKFQKKGRPNKNRRSRQDDEGDGIAEQVIKINRVAKVVKGGKNFSFSALVVAGDGNGNYGLGFGKSNEVVGAIKKGSGNARKDFKKVNLKGDTIPHQIIGRYKASRVILKPAGRGTGVIAGGPVRALCDAIGVKDILTKSLGSRNAINVAKAAANGFSRLRLKRKG